MAYTKPRIDLRGGVQRECLGIQKLETSVVGGVGGIGLGVSDLVRIARALISVGVRSQAAGDKATPQRAQQGRWKETESPLEK